MTERAWRILLVEDEALVALYTRELLEESGYEVVGIAATGEGALELAGETQPDLALVDIRLPGGMDGVDTALRLVERHGTTIIFVSGTLDEPILERTRAVRPHACIQKPVRPFHLMEAVRQALAERER